ncbi:MAG: hypothetical protein ACRC62_03815 [Microcoleus sp.]
MEIPQLTKREYFAAMALHGLAANEGLNDIDAEESAFMAVYMADELIDALKYDRVLIVETLCDMAQRRNLKWVQPHD